MNATLNIGLNNNPFTPSQILEKLISDYHVHAYSIKDGEYEGQHEPTLAVQIVSDYARTSHFIKKIEELATILTQNCIAVSTDQFDLLVYAQNYNGQQYKFDNQYFIKI